MIQLENAANRTTDDPIRVEWRIGSQRENAANRITDGSIRVEWRIGSQMIQLENAASRTQIDILEMHTEQNTDDEHLDKGAK